MTSDREPRKASLSPTRQRLLGLMQELNFGWIEGLQVRQGEPSFDPPPRIVREIKLGCDSQPTRECEERDFALKTQVMDLFDLLTRLDNGEVEFLQVKHGLPFLVHIEGVGRL